jgi:cytochrome o ubiquinol oxidase subunit 3
MTRGNVQTHQPWPDSYRDEYARTVFGFWIYLLTDFVMFATIFAVYAVLHKSTFGGPGPKELFNLFPVMIQTWILLLTTFFVSLGGAAAHRKQRASTIVYFLIAFIGGLLFLGLMSHDIALFLKRGASWKISGYMSAYFTLIGTFAVHMIFGLIWTIVLLIPVFCRGVDMVDIRRLTCLRMLWQFLNIVWIFIFSLVYLLGVIQ